MSDLLLRDGEWDVVEPGSAGWRYLSFRVERLRDGENVARNTGGEEITLVPLGGRCAIDTSGERYELSVFPSCQFFGPPEEALRVSAEAYLH